MNEKTARYITRTIEHIHRVQKNMLMLVIVHSEKFKLTDEQLHEAMQNIAKHDNSKFSDPQWQPYVELTEYFHQKRTLGNKNYEYPPGVEEKVEEAVRDHYRKENHHPEGLVTGADGWSVLQAMECACDLQAMAQEYGEGSGRKYYLDHWKRRSESYFIPWNWREVQKWMDRAFDCFEGLT